MQMVYEPEQPIIWSLPLIRQDKKIQDKSTLETISGAFCGTFTVTTDLLLVKEKKKPVGVNLQSEGWVTGAQYKVLNHKQFKYESKQMSNKWFVWQKLGFQDARLNKRRNGDDRGLFINTIVCSDRTSVSELICDPNVLHDWHKLSLTAPWLLQPV